MSENLPAQIAPPLSPKNCIFPAEGEEVSFQNRRYRIGAQIGQGSFGIVYGCTDEWGNDLAAKVLVPKGRPYEVVQKDWVREFQNLLTLRHPNITHIYSAFEWRDTFYIITERCTKSVSELIASDNFKGEFWLLPMARCVLQGLDFIHQAGYVHKDLHPGNVFLHFVRDEMMPQEHSAMLFKIGDLGITKLASEIDVFNTILAQWMLPPEAIDSAQFGVLGPRTDIYHAGLLCLNLLAGRIFNFTREEILAGKPRQTAESLNTPYAPAIARALRRHVADRTPTPLDFWRELSALTPKQIVSTQQQLPNLGNFLSNPPNNLGA